MIGSKVWNSVYVILPRVFLFSQFQHSSRSTRGISTMKIQDPRLKLNYRLETCTRQSL